MGAGRGGAVELRTLSTLAGMTDTSVLERICVWLKMIEAGEDESGKILVVESAEVVTDNAALDMLSATAGDVPDSPTLLNIADVAGATAVEATAIIVEGVAAVDVVAPTPEETCADKLPRKLCARP